ncbi:MAG: hypothetical protein MJY89_05415 [Bacteroidales bacterium]|nr:hypothetical protein [Bacteroidales bacterium]
MRKIARKAKNNLIFALLQEKQPEKRKTTEFSRFCRKNRQKSEKQPDFRVFARKTVRKAKNDLIFALLQEKQPEKRKTT